MSLALVAGVAVLGAVAASRRWVVVRVQGSSMSPTLSDGQLLLARRVRRARAVVRRQDLVVFELNPGPVVEGVALRVKRVAASAGEPLPGWAHGLWWAKGHAVVPPGKVVVAGDNPKSQGSRELGFIDHAAIVAWVPAR